MATKKEKRAKALAHYEERMETLRRTGLAAQKADRDHRDRMLKQEWEEQHEKKHSWKKRVKECPHCNEELRAAKKMSEHAV